MITKLQNKVSPSIQQTSKEKSITDGVPREQLFSHDYFAGGRRFGGYFGEGYRDFPAHEITFAHVMARKPTSVLEIGCARGPIIKRLRDVGVEVRGLEISKHACMTRWSEDVFRCDICIDSWPLSAGYYDLCFSIAVMEHIPEQFLPNVIQSMQRTCKRGLHGIDFGNSPAAQEDKTHCTLHPPEWWVKIFHEYAPGWPVEIVDKEDLEKGTFPEAILKGDGKLKLNIGSFTTQYHHGWTNIDVADLGPWAQSQGYKYLRHDVRTGLSYGTGTVDFIAACHFFEHLTYDEGISFLRECRRVIKPDGRMRFQVPDAELLMNRYTKADLFEFDEVNEACAKAKTQAKKLYELLHAGHSSIYDINTLSEAFEETGFIPDLCSFRQGTKQLLVETLDTLPCLTLFMEASPNIG